MLLKKWENLPFFIKNNQVMPYYIALNKKGVSLIIKRILDILFAFIFTIILLPFMIIIAIITAIESGFPILYKQERITTYGRCFKVLKFRTMVKNADKIGSLVTVDNDPRITKTGKFLRKYRLDELPQILNVLKGDMSFVGTRPEVKAYVDAYTDEMYATLLMPAGVTSQASISFKDEAKLLDNSDDVFKTYTEVILPQKMKFNLEYIKNFNILLDFKTVFNTIFAVFK